MLRRFVVLLLLSTAACAALTNPPNGGYCAEAGSVRVLLGLQLSPDGHIEKAWVLQGGPPSFNQAALKGIRKFRFKPGPKFIEYWMCFILDAFDAGVGPDAG